MEFGPIFRTLRRNKTRFTLITLEIALTLAIVGNCVNMIVDYRRLILRPTGLDEANLLSVVSQPFSPDFREEGYLENSRQADLKLLRALPGVRSAESISSTPLSGSGSSSGFKPLGAKTDTLPTAHFGCGPQITKALGVRLIEGRDFQESDVTEAEEKNILITKVYANALFADGKAVGKQIQGRTPEHPATIVGVIERMHGSWPGWEHIERVVLYPDRPGSVNWGLRFMVRAVPGETARLVKTIEEELVKANNGRNVEVRTLSDIKADTYQAQIAMIQMLSGLTALLILVTALGIVGITAFSVAERTKQIGTRRALGARKLDIVRYFLVENWLISTIGLILGTGFAYALNYGLVTLVEGAKLEPRLVIVGVVLLWIVSLGAALGPVLRATRISPASATRTV
ncbi:MAG: FtsX-like permease family protein [Acidobacteria bacterium]|nr:MAG: FtsX-like permease family protein [Acidobacteriota bacterium]